MFHMFFNSLNKMTSLSSSGGVDYDFDGGIFLIGFIIFGFLFLLTEFNLYLTIAMIIGSMLGIFLIYCFFCIYQHIESKKFHNRLKLEKEIAERQIQYRLQGLHESAKIIIQNGLGN